MASTDTATPRLSKSARTRETVLVAAEALFSERGFDATSLNVIGEQAGIQGSAILYHFSSKRELYEAVLDRMFAPMLDQARRDLLGDGSPADRLAASAATMVRFAAARPAAARLVMREAFAGSPEAGDILGDASARHWRNFIDTLAREDAVDFDPLVVWNIVIGAICFYFGAGPTVGGLPYDPCEPARAAAFETRMVHLVQSLCGAESH